MTKKNLTQIEIVRLVVLRREMTLKVLNIFALGTLLCPDFLGAMEGQSDLSPAKIRKIQQTNASYKICVSTATNDVKTGTITAQALPAAMAKCKDKYPGAALFLECKKKVLGQAKGTELDPEAVAECKKFLTAANFEPEDPVPLFISGTQAFFAGLGMNRSLSHSELELPNFTCEKYQDSLTNVAAKAQHILFGNHPKLFSSGPQQVKVLKSIEAVTKLRKKSDKYMDVPAFGRVFGDVQSAQSIVYFPSSSCDFQGVLGQIFSGLSMYYMPDITAKTASPYFGIAYYRNGQTKVTTPQVVTELLKRLGSNYKAYSKNKETVFISSTQFQEVDQERDPRNICAAPRPHQFVGVVHSVKGKPTIPEYLILANIRNLCDYGDRLAGSIAAK